MNRFSRLWMNSYILKESNKRAELFYTFFRTNKLILFLFVLIISFIYFAWIKIMQLMVINPKLLSYYPYKFFLTTLSLGGLVFITLWLFLQLFYNFISKDNVVHRIPVYTAFSFLSFLSGPFSSIFHSLFPHTFKAFFEIHHPVQISIWLFILYNAALFLYVLSRERIKEYKSDIFALIIIVLAIVILVPPLSPIQHYDFRGHFQEWDGLHGTGQKPIIDSVYYSLPWIDQAAAYGARPVEFTANFSYFTGIISLLTGISDLDVTSRIFIYKYIFFSIVIFGCFSFYLYSRYGLILSYYASLFGGVFYFLANNLLLYQLNYYNIGYWQSYFILPFVLLMITLSIRKDNLLLAAVAGFSYSAFVYITYPHAPLFKTLFIFLILPYSLLFILASNKKNTGFLKLCIFISANILGFALYTLPLFDAIRSGEMSLFIRAYRDYGINWSTEGWGDTLVKIFIDGFNTRDTQGGQFDGKHFMFVGYLMIIVFYFYINIHKIIYVLNDRVNLFIIVFWALITLFTFYILMFGSETFVHNILRDYKLGYLQARYRFSPIWHVCVLVLSVFSLDHIIKYKKGFPIIFSIFLFYVSMTIIYFLFFKGSVQIMISSIVTAMYATVALIFLKLKPDNKLVKIGFIVSILIIYYIANPEIFKSYRVYPVYVSLKSVLYNYDRFADDQRAYAFIRSIIIQLKKDLIKEKNKHEISIADGNLPTIRSYDIVRKILKKFPHDSLFYNDKKRLLEFGEENADDIDYFYFLLEESKTGSKVYLHPVGNFNGIALDYYNLKKGYWIFLQSAMQHRPPKSTHPNIDFTSWFGGHGVIRASNRASLYTKNTEVTYKEYVYDNYRAKAYNISGIDYVLFCIDGNEDINKIEAYNFLVLNGYKSIKNHARFGENCPYIFENPNSFGRAYFAEKINIIPVQRLESFTQTIDERNETEEFASALNRAKEYINGITQHREVVVEGLNNNIAEYINNKKIRSELISIRIKANKAVFEVEVKENMDFFVYNEAALKDWVVYYDDKPLKTYYTNIAFMGSIIPSGKHLIWFEYRPLAKTIGVLIILCTLIILLYLLMNKLNNDRPIY